MVILTQLLLLLSYNHRVRAVAAVLLKCRQVSRAALPSERLRLVTMIMWASWYSAQMWALFLDVATVCLRHIAA